VADERSRAVEMALAQIEKQFGKGSIMRLGSKEAVVPISVRHTQSKCWLAEWGSPILGEFYHPKMVQAKKKRNPCWNRR
jgi:hypothetical protein